MRCVCERVHTPEIEAINILLCTERIIELTSYAFTVHTIFIFHFLFCSSIRTCNGPGHRGMPNVCVQFLSLLLKSKKCVCGSDCVHHSWLGSYVLGLAGAERQNSKIEENRNKSQIFEFRMLWVALLLLFNIHDCWRTVNASAYPTSSTSSVVQCEPLRIFDIGISIR